MRKLLLTAAVMFGAAGLAVLWTQPGAQAAQATTAAQANPLGDLSAMATIVDETQAIVATGDMARAEARITDLETAWDEAEQTMRPKDPTAWGDVDAATDDALTALRAGAPDPAEVTASLAALQASLAHPSGGAGPATSGIEVAADGTVATTDANGHAIPCEDFVRAVSAALAASTASAGDKAKATDLLTRGTERCNADDDARADDFMSRALVLVAPRA